MGFAVRLRSLVAGQRSSRQLCFRLWKLLEFVEFVWMLGDVLSNGLCTYLYDCLVVE